MSVKIEFNVLISLEKLYLFIYCFRRSQQKFYISRCGFGGFGFKEHKQDTRHYEANFFFKLF